VAQACGLPAASQAASAPVLRRPNHVHSPATPAVPLPKLTKSLKGIAAKRGTAMLALTGASFWQEESYDRPVRNTQEFGNYRGAAGGAPEDQEVRPTIHRLSK
jgi:hypothetical protein